MNIKNRVSGLLLFKAKLANFSAMSWLEPMIYRTRGQPANHYTTDAVVKNQRNISVTKKNVIQISSPILKDDLM